MGWDDEIPYVQGLHWQRWLADVPKLSEFTVDRCFKLTNFGDISSSQLHHYSDASETEFGSVSYLRLVDNNGKIHCSFLQGKSRLVPLKQLTFPRLELSAATISVRLDKAQGENVSCH